MKRALFGLVGGSMLLMLSFGGVAPAVASAGPLKLGSNNATAAAGEHCSNGVSWVQRATASNSPSYRVPYAGTITSWTTSSGANASTAALKIWQPTSNPNQFIPVAQSATVSVPGGNTLKTFSTSLHVEAGDVIGVATFSGNALSCIYFAPSANAGDAAAYVSGDPTSGTQTVTDCLGSGCSGGTASRLNVSVTFQPSSASRIYWGDCMGGISFADLNGTGHGGDLNTAGVTPNCPDGIAMDLLRGKIYWADTGASVAATTISFANLNGTGGGRHLHTTGATTPFAPTGVATDPATGKVYWADAGGPLSFANLNNTGGGSDLSTSGATVSNPAGVAIDPATGKIYWSDFGNSTISFANLNGSGGGGELHTKGAKVNRPEGVAIDPANGKIYWANSNDNTHPISFANLNDTGGGGNLNVTGATPDFANGVAIDPEAGKIYWANESGDTISFANLNDTGGGGQLNTSGASTPAGPAFPALLKVPLATAKPKLSGRSTVGSKLSCSKGTWAPDLLESFLYQQPVSLSYAWSRNSKSISGATKHTITAPRRGIYTCTVTATNQAGSTNKTSAAHKVT